MKKLVLAIFSAALWMQADAQIAFHNGTWAEALAKAKKENKLIFMDAYTTWCGPCKWLAKNVFTDKEVGEFFNKNFVCVKMDMEKGEGIALAEKYGVQAYPTLLYIDGNGELAHRNCGAVEAPEFIEQGRTALDPSKQFATYHKKYESGKPDASLAYTYLSMREDGCMDYEKELRHYLNNVPESELGSRDNWKIIYSFVNDAQSREFLYLVEHKDDLAKMASVDSVNNKIMQVYQASLMSSIKKKDSVNYEFFKSQLKKSGHPEATRITMESDMRYYRVMDNTEAYAASSVLYIEKYGKDNAGALNNAAWGFYETVDDPKMLNKALEWSKRSVELENSYANNDTYAALHYKLGNKQEAMKAAQKAIDIAKKNGDDAKETEQLMKKIKALK
jgi:thioredoxin-related protein